MSRVSEWLKRVLHASPGESTAQVATRFLGEHQGDVEEYAQEVVALLHFSDLNGEDKRVIARQLVIAAGKSFGIVIPSWIADFVVQEALMLLRSHDTQHLPDNPIPVRLSDMTVADVGEVGRGPVAGPIPERI